MSRPIKEGLSYYPMDVDFWDDFKIMDLLNEYGPTGVAVYQVVLSEIYKSGYYLEVSTDRLAAKVIRTVGNHWIKDKALVEDIIGFCAEQNLLDKELFSQGILTSEGIQRRYSEIGARRKTDKSRYWLLPDKESENNSPSNPETAKTDTQKKQKKSVKAKDISDKEVSSCSASNKDEEADKSDYTYLQDYTTEQFIAAETPDSAAIIPQKKSKVNKSKENKNKGKESKVCGRRIPCKNGEFFVDDEYYTELTHTYPSLDIDKSFKKMVNYLTSHPEKQGFTTAAKSYIEMWLSDDDNCGRYRKTTAAIQPTYDIGDYESTSVLDETDEDWQQYL